ncbi:hypothetical protein FPZ52_06150 [Qingshengfaniella alkalisoli]|uniref:Type IV pilus biogenesis protein PilP n=1 Tax=Qingshengfaniella alkalisoli TaxID=2599296 RepID=A0A5B8IXE8_9RHOB|nr:hypothetical protein FPZ52_06150 [Qingshengfaniella alkalisoli]
MAVLPAEQIRIETFPITPALAVADPSDALCSLIEDRIKLPRTEFCFDWLMTSESMAVAIVARKTMREAAVFVTACGLKLAGMAGPAGLPKLASPPWFGDLDTILDSATAANVAPIPPVTPIAPKRAPPPAAAAKRAISSPAPPDINIAREHARFAARLQPFEGNPDHFEDSDASAPVADVERRSLGALIGRLRPNPPKRTATGKAKLVLTLAAVLTLVLGTVVLLPRSEPATQHTEAPVAEIMSGSVPEATPEPDVEDPATDVTPVPRFADADLIFSPDSAMRHSPVAADLDGLEQPGLDPELGADAVALQDATGLTRPEMALRLSAVPEAGEASGEDIVIADDAGADPEPDPLLEAMRKARPPQRPDDLAERFERYQFGGRTFAELARLRPTQRPDEIEDAAARIAEAQALIAEATELAADQTPRPKLRPDGVIERAVAARVAAKMEGREDLAEVATAASTAAVAPARPQPQPQQPAPQAQPQQTVLTTRGAGPDKIILSDINLLGTFGKSGSQRALVRLSSGRVMNVSVGDRLDGGRVAAIRTGELTYTKGNRNYLLRMPQG